jgi:hypothetical protein
MIDVVYYLTATGEITGTASFEDDSVAADWTAEMDVSESYLLATASADTDYILAGAVTTRPVITEDAEVTIDADGTTLVDFVLPTGTVVEFRGVDYTAAGGEHFQFKSVLVGPFEFAMTPPFPYSPMIFRVICDAV